MKGKDENNISMKLAVEKVLSEYQINWTGIPKFADAVTEFKNDLAEIENQRKVQEKHTTGVTDDKTAKKIVMCEDAVVVAKVVKTYAKINNDKELVKVVDYSYSDLFRVRDSDSKVRCEEILDAATPIETNLINEYGLNSMDVANLNSGITSYGAVIAAPTLAKGKRKMAGVNITKLVKDTDDILKNIIDNLMETFKKTMPDFYGKYTNARIIIDLGKRKKPAVAQIKGVTLNFETDKPEGAVKVRLEDGSSETVSNAAGEFVLPVDKEGTITIIAEKTGFEKFEEDVDVMKDEDIEMNIDMEPIGEEVPPEEV